MHRLFLPLDEDVSCRLMENGKMLLDIAHLIDRKCVERYHNKFTPLAPSCASARCSFQDRGRRIISSKAHSSRSCADAGRGPSTRSGIGFG